MPPRPLAGPFRPAALTCVLTLALLLGGAGRRASASDPESDAERAVGRVVSKALESNAGVEDDPLLADWVRRVGAKVASQSPRRDLLPSFVIVGSDVSNALTLPGGTVLVTRGLLDSVASDDELASVLAHETGHVAKKHAVRLIEGTLIVDGAGYALQRAGYPRAASVLSLYNIFRTLRKSRDQEQQADDLGIAFSYGAGYDPRGLVEFLGGFAGGRPNVLEQYLATHPDPEKRIERARRSPLVAQSDPVVRETVAAGFDARGLPGLAAAERAGGEPLLAPPPVPPAPPGDPAVARDREYLIRQSEDGRKDLLGAYRARSVGGPLQDVLLINPELRDPGWDYLAARAYGVQDRLDDLYARTLRVLRQAPAAYDRLAAAGGDADPAGQDAAQGREDAQRAVGHARAATKPLRRAATAIAFVLLDLNNHYLRPRGRSAPWIRLVADEVVLRYAESELARADRYSGRGWRQLALSQVRGYQARLDAVAPRTDARRRAAWARLVERRFGKPPGDADGVPTGDATVRAALAVELGRPPADIDGGRGATPWADWLLKEKGTPENVATAMRLLTLELERESAAEDRYAIGSQ